MDQKLIRILENDDWIIDYDKDKRKYRVSKFEDYHFKDEIWFDAYEEKEIPLPEALDNYTSKNYTLAECNISEEELEEIIDKWNSIGHTSFYMTPEGAEKCIEQAKQDLIKKGVDLDKLKKYVY